jgi:prepilin peptidase CpaA
MVSLQIAGVVVAIAACATGTVTDLKKGVIPNWITVPSMVIGLGLSLAFNGWMGLFLSMLSALATAMAPLLLFRFNAMGGGDVKLFFAIGSLLGIDLSLQVLMASFCAGAVYGIGLWVARGELKTRFRNMIFKVIPIRILKNRSEISPGEPTYIRFAPAILVGCLITVALNLEVLGYDVW